MTDVLGGDRDLASLIVPRVGAVVAVDDVWEPVRLLDPSGSAVGAVRLFLQDLQAAGRSTATQRSYAMDLLRWFRFGWAVEVRWDRATRIEARDFCRWLALREKPFRAAGAAARLRPDQPNAVTGRPGPGDRYASSTRAHSETVLRVFYEFHCEAGTGPMANPFPLARGRQGGRSHAHHNPLAVRSGLRIAFRHRLCIDGRARARQLRRCPGHLDQGLPRCGGRPYAGLHCDQRRHDEHRQAGR
jgi:Phage integrase, N-terminal SAM-like domain